MSDPFEYLEEAEDVARVGIGWLPLSLAGLAMAGFLAVPTLGFLKRKDKADDWSSFVVEDSVPVPSDSPDSFETLPTPNPEDLQQDLESVDETLGNLGVAYVEPAAAPTPEVPPLQALPIQTSPLQDKAVAKRPVPAPSVPARPEGPHFEWTVKKGETLYGIGRKAGTTPRMIAKMNGIKVDTPIVPGQVLKIPGHRPVVVKPLVVSSKSSYPDAATPLRETVAQARVASPRDSVARKRIPKKTPNAKEASEPLAQEPKARVRPSSNLPKVILVRPRPVDRTEAKALPRPNRPPQNESAQVPPVNHFPR